MEALKKLESFEDSLGNRIVTEEMHERNISVLFRGKNNVLYVAPGAKIGRLSVSFDGDNGVLELGHNRKTGWLQANVRVGQDSTVRFGNNVSTTATCVISAVEGTKVIFGDDVMIASDNQFRADDGHPIFDVESRKRVNKAKDIIVGNHVWFAYGACVLGGVTIGSGSVVGFKALVTKSIPNNVVAAGLPAKVVRRNIAWERPHLSLTAPPYKPDASTVKTSDQYWALTEVPAVQTRPQSVSRVRQWAGKAAPESLKRLVRKARKSATGRAAR